MEQYSRISETNAYVVRERTKGRTIGFVPTMGALHKGHLSLIERSKSENDLTICSIFVNPIQFNNKADLEKYPRNLKEDCEMLANSGCDLVFTPEVDEMYPDGKIDPFTLDFGTLDKILEGKHRPGHFNGVAIVVKKLFDIVQPNRAYFGRKDYQQLLIVSKMVELLKLPVEIVPCPIVREPDGLAMSSRNMRLTIGERQVAPEIYRVLSAIKDRLASYSLAETKKWAIKRIEEEPSMRVEYLEIVDAATLVPLTNRREKNKAIILIAVFLSDIRLIDNVELFL